MPPQPTPEFQRRTMLKVSWRLLPLIVVCYLMAYIDRTNVSFAALTMNQDLGLTAYMYGLGAGIFFLGYALFEVPSNMVLHRIGARVWIARIMITWGIISGLMAAATGPDQLPRAALSAGRGRGRVLSRHHLLSHLLVSVRLSGTRHIDPVSSRSRSRMRSRRSSPAPFSRWTARLGSEAGNGCSSSRRSPRSCSPSSSCGG